MHVDAAAPFPGNHHVRLQMLSESCICKWTLRCGHSRHPVTAMVGLLKHGREGNFNEGSVMLWFAAYAGVMAHLCVIKDSPQKVRHTRKQHKLHQCGMLPLIHFFC